MSHDKLWLLAEGTGCFLEASFTYEIDLRDFANAVALVHVWGDCRSIGIWKSVNPRGEKRGVLSGVFKTQESSLVHAVRPLSRIRSKRR